MRKNYFFYSMLSLMMAGASYAENSKTASHSIYDRYGAEAEVLVKRMTLEEKIGQMTLPSVDFLLRDGGLHKISTDKLGGVLPEGNTVPAKGPNLEQWQALSRAIKAYPVQVGEGTRIPLLMGTDAVHGNQHVAYAVIFPHNIGLGATHDTQLVEMIAAWTAYDVKQSGFNWVFAPTVANAHDYRWGRTYESFTSDPKWLKANAAAYVKGAQAISDGQLHGVLTSAKHFIGDGNTDAGVDEGDATVTDNATFLRENYPGYEGAFSAECGNVMASYSSINRVPMSVNLDYMHNYLLPHFDGFVVSDYGAIDKVAVQLHQPYDKVLADAINSGIDMVMLSKDYHYYKTIAGFQKILLQDVKKKWIKESRIDEAVKRILQVKFAMGLFDNKPVSFNKPAQDEKQIALQAAQESLVLLKNQAVLPLAPNKVTHLILIGDQGYTYDQVGRKYPNHIYKFDDIGSQCGGWTVVWQGYEGNGYAGAQASSILTGIKSIVGKHTALYTNPTHLTKLIKDNALSAENTAAIVVLAEFPYAEFIGDVGNHNPLYDSKMNAYAPPHERDNLIMSFNARELHAVQQLKAQHIPVIVVLLSGRPMSVDSTADAPLYLSDAFVAAWLPGTQGGEAIANALFGRYHFGSHLNANTLPFAWPTESTRAFPVGYGLKD